MLIEPSANHLTVFGPGVIRIQRRVDAHKALSVFLDERHHVLLLACVHVQFTRRVGEDQGVEVVKVLGISLQIFLGQQLGICPQRGVPKSTLFAHFVNGSHRGRDRLMFPTLGLAYHQNVLQVDRFGVRLRRQQRVWRELLCLAALKQDRRTDQGERKQEEDPKKAHAVSLQKTGVILVIYPEVQAMLIQRTSGPAVSV